MWSLCYWADRYILCGYTGCNHLCLSAALVSTYVESLTNVRIHTVWVHARCNSTDVSVNYNVCMQLPICMSLVSIICSKRPFCNFSKSIGKRHFRFRLVFLWSKKIVSIFDHVCLVVSISADWQICLFHQTLNSLRLSFPLRIIFNLICNLQFERMSQISSMKCYM